ncbi:MAG: MaoC/PaaZ C-terminal domain-containing protein [Chromatocurvus sp.]
MLYFEDFYPGRSFELGPCTVDGGEMLAFAERFDPQGIHQNADSAATAGFPEIIASGWFTASLFMRMQCDAFMLDSACIASPGIDNLRWLQPVVAGQVLQGRVTVTSVRTLKSRPDTGVVTCDGSLYDGDGEVLMTLSSSAFYRRKE